MTSDSMAIMGALKAVKWEEAKGALRAFAALSGSYPVSEGQGERWKAICESVDSFIRDIEDRGLHE